jgi:hypothetical protein
VPSQASGKIGVPPLDFAQRPHCSPRLFYLGGGCVQIGDDALNRIETASLGAEGHLVRQKSLCRVIYYECHGVARGYMRCGIKGVMNSKKLFNLSVVLALALAMGVLLISLPLTVASAKGLEPGSRATPSSLSLSTTPITYLKRLAIYYSWPSLVNGAGCDVIQATTVFTQFDIVVFGGGLEDSSHRDHIRTITITNNLKEGGIKIYGYIDLGISTANLDLVAIETRVNNWAAMGATGIFYDNAGRDFGVSRTRLISAVDLAHNYSPTLSVFVNAWNPDDVFADGPEGTVPLKKGDWYLAESHPVSGDLCLDLGFWWDKSHKLITYREQISGVRIAAVGTGNQGPTNTITNPNHWNDHSPFRQPLWAACLFGFDAFGFTNPEYSASGDDIDHLRPLPPITTNIGTMYLGPPAGPVAANGILTYSRPTDEGIIYVSGGADDPTICDGTFRYGVDAASGNGVDE